VGHPGTRVAMTESVAVAIPAYDAGSSVADVVRRALALIPNVLVVDDGSRDETCREASDAGAEVISHRRNLGKGAALRLAFSELFGRGFKAVVTVDADGQHLPEEIPKLIARWGQGGDLVMGTRDHLYAEMSRARRASNTLSSRAISFFAGVDLRDCQTGFRLYTRELIEKTGFPEPRFEAESAVIVRAARRGMSILAVPVRLGFADGLSTSHYRPVIDSLRIAAAVARARFVRS
jgi:glycosyltransferase involved in cell wall biosynthesis